MKKTTMTEVIEFAEKCGYETTLNNLGFRITTNKGYSVVSVTKSGLIKFPERLVGGTEERTLSMIALAISYAKGLE